VIDLKINIQNIAKIKTEEEFEEKEFEDEKKKQHQRRRGGGNNTTSSSTIEFKWKRGRLYDRFCAIILLEMCVEDRNVKITSVNKKQASKRKPLPLSTVELQRKCSNYFRIPSSQTMKVAEDLYQRGFISYPRTETDSFNEGIDLIGFFLFLSYTFFGF